MKTTIQLLFFLILNSVISCQTSKTSDIASVPPVELTLKMANQLATLPLQCVEQEYPNKLSQVIANESDLQTPSTLHPSFYGCFDWHSAVHGHWSLVKLLKEYPNLEKGDSIKILLKKRLSKENIKVEMAYFDKKHNKTYERTYGWAWLLKLSAELHTWQDPLARELEDNLKPLSLLIAEKYKEYLPKLMYPIRVGTHSNTAFGLSFAYDYATLTNDTIFKKVITKRAKDFYLQDKGCPIQWEPSGYDFLSPCLEEMDIMRKVLPKEAFFKWLNSFMPNIIDKSFTLEVGEVGDRSDGHLVHLDGLNFSRAWCLYGLANQYQEFTYLNELSNTHVNYALPNLVGDSYEGGHWLASFAINALAKHE